MHIVIIKMRMICLHFIITFLSTVWLELMMPVIGLKNYSGLVVDYGSTVFGGGGGAGECGHVLGVRQFFSIFDFTWVTSVSLPRSVQRQLFALYPKVKVRVIVYRYLVV